MLLRRAIALFLPFAVLATLASGLVYVTAQQLLRQGANDPQLQLAEDAARLLDAGAAPESVTGPANVDIADSLAPFVTVFDAGGVALWSDGYLDGYDPSPPAGVLAAAAAGAPNMVTWQPRPGLRLATVTVRWRGGTVFAGRSLREVERRTDQLLLLVAAGWVVMLGGVGLACVIAARVWPGPGSGGTDRPAMP